MPKPTNTEGREAIIERLRADAEGARGVADGNAEVLATADNLERAADLLAADASLEDSFKERVREELLGEDAVEVGARERYERERGPGTSRWADLTGTNLGRARQRGLRASFRQDIQAALAALDSEDHRV